MDSVSIFSHLDELFLRFRRIMIWILIGGALGYYFSDPIYEGLTRPVREYLGASNPLVFTRFFEKVGVLFRIALIVGFLISSPMIAYEILAFVIPGLKPRE